MKPEEARAIARKLREQHEKYNAGFYGSGPLNGRWFNARAITDGSGSHVEVWAPDTWTRCPDGQKFSDHNGRPIPSTDIKYDAIAYGIEPEDYQKLRDIQAALHNGTDRERDHGHRLWLILNRAQPLKASDLS